MAPGRGRVQSRSDHSAWSASDFLASLVEPWQAGFRSGQAEKHRGNHHSWLAYPFCSRKPLAGRSAGWLSVLGKRRAGVPAWMVLPPKPDSLSLRVAVTNGDEFVGNRVPFARPQLPVTSLDAGYRNSVTRRENSLAKTVWRRPRMVCGNVQRADVCGPGIAGRLCAGQPVAFVARGAAGAALSAGQAAGQAGAGAFRAIFGMWRWICALDRRILASTPGST